MPLDSLSRPASVDCLSFENAGDGKCKHYTKGGDCALFSICTEWEKRNVEAGARRRAERAAHDGSSLSPTDNSPTARDAPAPDTRSAPHAPQRRQLALLGALPPEAATERPGATIHEIGAFITTTSADGRTTHHGPRGPVNDPTPRGSAPAAPVVEIIGAHDVAALAARGYELCLEGWNNGPDVWIVPNLTGADRVELTYQNAATLANMVAAFPGARVKAITYDASGQPHRTDNASAG